MKLSKFITLIAISAIACSTTNARIISTFEPGGADAELRESAQTQNRGDSTELASRVDSREGTNFPRNSVMYVKLPVGAITPAELAAPITYRMTFRNNNLPASRVSDTSVNNPPIHPDDYTGLDYWVLDPTNADADWDESAIIPLAAPGYNWDGDMSTNPIIEGAGNFTPIGSQKFRPFDFVDTQATENWYPVGEAMDIEFAPGSPLHQAIAAAQGTDHETITIASKVSHPGDVMLADGSDFNSAWLGFNYLFNPKEQTTLNDDPNYDANVVAMDGAEGSPWSGATNSIDTPFAPQLITIPEPSSVVLVGLAGLIGGAVIRRRK